MTRTFCTLFDKNFLHRGLALYASCVAQGDPFHLWILCLDDDTKHILDVMHLEHATPLSLEDIGDEDLRSLRTMRGPGEFAWTSKSSLMRYLMRTRPRGEFITYLDSDLFFFASPSSIFSEHEPCSILMTPHRFLPEQKNKEKNVGVFNAGFISLRNDEIGNACVLRWREQCLAWCKGVYEDGKFGDQMYLDEWPTLYGAKACVLDRGINAGSWNTRPRDLSEKNGRLYAGDTLLVCYHFHTLKMYFDARGELQAYPVTRMRRYLDNPYLDALRKAIRDIHTIDPDFAISGGPRPGMLRLLKQHVVRFFA